MNLIIKNEREGSKGTKNRFRYMILSMNYSFDLTEIEGNLDKNEKYWNSFIQTENFELGILKLDPGVSDIQNPHKSDEVYFIIEGDGYLQINGIDYEIKPKLAMFVPKKLPHKFHGNTRPILAYYALN